MQAIGYLLIGNVKIRVLVRANNYQKYIRKSDGKTQAKDVYLEEESEYLSRPENYLLVERLHEGKTIVL